MVLPPKIRSTLFAALAAAAFWLHAAPAAADETPAERLFRDGRALMLDGRFDDACPMLEESHRLEPHVGTLLNVAACHERQGKVASAWVDYQKALTAARAEGQAERAQLAAERIKVLEPRVPWLRISSTVDDVAIALDGGRIEHVAWGQEMPVDPGPHVVTAERGGAKVFEERLELRESDHRSVRIDLGAAPAAQDRIVVEPKPSEPPAPATTKRNKGSWVLEPGLFLGFVAGSSPRSIATSGSSDKCTTGTCGALLEAGGVAVGVNLFAGYALSDTVHLGARFIGAPPLGSNGASIEAIGPSIALHATEAFTVGAWAFFGNATLKGRAEVPSPGTGSIAAAADLYGGAGLGVELSLRLFELQRGEIIANATPFFIVGSNGGAVCLPLGLAYRFQ